MDRIELKKNVLDLSYKRNLQILNIVLISGIGAIFAYIGALILTPVKIFSYTFVMLLIGLIMIILYNNLNSNLKDISNRIRNLITTS